MNIDPKDIDVVILCGGLGKRLRAAVNDRPKPIAEIKGRPFLDLLMDYVSSFGFSRFILCIGYKGELIRYYYENGHISPHQFSSSCYLREHDKVLLKNWCGDISGGVLFSEENSPLGTAGAVKNAKRFIKNSPFIVMNGDSICKLNLIEFLEFHMSKNALVSIALTASMDVSSFGTVELDETQRIIRFSEKTKSSDSNNLINAGVYIFNKEALSSIPENKNYSLEYNLFPKLDRCYGYITNGELIDIGTPEGYEMAKKTL